MNNDDNHGGLLIRRDPLETDPDFCKYVLVQNASLGSNGADDPLFGIKFDSLPFCVRLGRELAVQLRDGLSTMLADCDHSIGGEAPPDHNWGDDGNGNGEANAGH